jgi:endonuclease YncB( thermonuclease family)
MKRIFYLLLSKLINKYLLTEFNQPRFDKFISNYDGDTMTVDLEGPDLFIYKNVKVRLKNRNHDFFDTAEIRGTSGETKLKSIKAKEFSEIFMKSKNVYIEYENGILDRDKYGRLLADFYKIEKGEKKYLTDLLVNANLGKYEKW